MNVFTLLNCLTIFFTISLGSNSFSKSYNFFAEQVDQAFVDLSDPTKSKEALAILISKSNKYIYSDADKASGLSLIEKTARELAVYKPDALDDYLKQVKILFEKSKFLKFNDAWRVGYHAPITEVRTNLSIYEKKPRLLESMLKLQKLFLNNIPDSQFTDPIPLLGTTAGSTMLEDSIDHLNLDAVNDLLKRGFDPNKSFAHTDKSGGDPPFFSAIFACDVEKRVDRSSDEIQSINQKVLAILNSLHSSGANFNKVEPYYNNSILHRMGSVDSDGSCNQESIISYLVQKGVDLNVLNKNEDTPLEVAFFQGNIEVFDLLLQNGASICIRNGDNSTVAERLNFTSNNPDKTDKPDMLKFPMIKDPIKVLVKRAQIMKLLASKFDMSNPCPKISDSTSTSGTSKKVKNH